MVLVVTAIPKKTLIALGLMWLFLSFLLIISQFAFPTTVTIEWETESEFETAGFNILKSSEESSNFTQINERLIASQADPAAGASYEYVDNDVVPGQTYYYRLEDVEFDNSTVTHEVLMVTAPERPWWILVLALVSSLIGIFLLVIGFRRDAGQQDE